MGNKYCLNFLFSVVMIGFFVLIPHGVRAENFLFDIDLSLGSRSKQVIMLQKILNQNSETRVASEGPGSPGNETEYFGRATQSAVIRFQEKYADEILVPKGLSRGTGYFGSATRRKILELLDASGKNKPEVMPVVAPTTDAFSEYLKNALKDSLDTVRISKITTQKGTVGSTVVLYGSGYSKIGNTIYFDENNSIEKVVAEDVVKISFTIPQNIPLGKHRVWVKNEKGISNKNFYFVVTGQNTVPPTLQKVTPSSGTVGTVVVVTGEHFSPKNNDIISPYGVIEGLSSPDGKTLSFPFTYAILEKIIKLKESGKKDAEKNILVPFTLVNDNGFTTNNLSFTITTTQ